MKKSYVKNESEYNEVEIDDKSIISGYSKLKKKLKHPTSVNLPEDVVVHLKEVAQKKGVPYQVLMRMFIIEGLGRLKDQDKKKNVA